MTAARIHVHRTPMPRLISVYLNFLCFVLAGYVVLGRAFAYLGFPPLYIGEMTLVLGIAAALMAGNLTGAIFNLPGIALALLMLWTVFRTIPYWNTYKFDALRDAVIVVYGLFAYIIASLILRRPVTLALLIERYKRFIPFVIFLSPVLPMVAYLSAGDSFVWTYGSQQVGGPKIIELSCHVPAVIAFSLIGFVRLRSLVLIFVLLIGLFLASQERQAMLTFTIGCFMASFFSPNRHALRNFFAVVGVVVVIVGIGSALNLRLAGGGDGRTFDARQLMTNAANVFSNSGSSRGDETREWRLNWWSDIIHYTLHGRYFWEGKGFGVNLADADGYQTFDDKSDVAPLRSPHNAHMTILARGGVPAIVMWIFALGSWGVAVVRQLIEARRVKDDWWAGVFAFLLTYWTIILISGSFDVALEGPVLGIWFWTIHGIGMAALVLHRHRVFTLQRPRAMSESHGVALRRLTATIHNLAGAGRGGA
jgi:O-antigen ligase/polysaccharide polymerase Wzy-like membrane protein